MPQGPIFTRDVNDATGYVANMTGNGTAIKTSACRVVKVNVVAASAGGVGSVYDCANTASTAAGVLVAPIPDTVGIYTLEIPLKTGCTIFPGGKMTLAVTLA